MNDYPELETLIGGWFHQDFDINGQTLDQIIAAYRAVTPVNQQQKLSLEVRRFLSETNDVDSEFEARFRPDVLPSGFAPSTAEFLGRILTLLDL